MKVISWIHLVASHVTRTFGKLVVWHFKRVFLLFCVVCRPIINIIPLPVGILVRLFQKELNCKKTTDTELLSSGSAAADVSSSEMDLQL